MVGSLSDAETGAQRRGVTCPRSHSQGMELPSNLRAFIIQFQEVARCMHPGWGLITLPGACGLFTKAMHDLNSWLAFAVVEVDSQSQALGVTRRPRRVWSRLSAGSALSIQRAVITDRCSVSLRVSFSPFFFLIACPRVHSAPQDGCS